MTVKWDKWKQHQICHFKSFWWLHILLNMLHIGLNSKKIELKNWLIEKLIIVTTQYLELLFGCTSSADQPKGPIATDFFSE